MDWQDFMSAFALYLVLEGLLPFSSPDGFRKMLVTAMGLPAKAIRQMGGFSIAAGLLLLYWVR